VKEKRGFFKGKVRQTKKGRKGLGGTRGRAEQMGEKSQGVLVTNGKHAVQKGRSGRVGGRSFGTQPSGKKQAQSPLPKDGKGEGDEGPKIYVEQPDERNQVQRGRGDEPRARLAGRKGKLTEGGGEATGAEDSTKLPSRIKNQKKNPKSGCREPRWVNGSCTACGKR